MAFIKLSPLAYNDLLFTPKALSSLGNLEPAPRHSNEHEIIQSDNEFRLSLDVPGVKASDLEITVDNEVLRIAGVRRSILSSGQTAKKTRFVKTFRVDPTTTDLAQLKANLADGVLIVSAPKITKPEPRVITITTDPHPEPASLEEEKKPVEKENESTANKGASTDKAKEPTTASKKKLNGKK